MLPDLPTSPGVRYRHIIESAGYCVGDDATVWSCRQRNGHGFIDEWHLLRPSFRNGYARYALKSGGGNGPPHQWQFIHRLLMIAFVGPPPSADANIVCHIDGNPKNNSLNNLRWGTYRENEADKRRHGTALLGTRHFAAKINDADVIQIRELAASGQTITVIAKRYGLARSTTRAIATGKAWQHVVTPSMEGAA